MSNDVSVIVALWNAETTIEKCILSIINQKDVNLEIIIIDDCSTDKSVEIVQELQKKYSQLKLLRNSVNSGPSVSRNKGINASTGRWVAIVDSDDFITEDRLSKLINHSNSNNSDICFDNLAFINSEGKASKGNVLISDKNLNLLNKNWDVVMYTNLNKPYESEVLIGFLKPLISREFINRHSIRYSETVKNSEDYLFILECLAHKAKVSYLHEANYFYLVNPSSLSGKFDLVAHDRLINEEVKFKDKFTNQLSKGEICAIDTHIQALKLAGTTNLMFMHLKQNEISSLISLLWRDKINFKFHILRLLFSIQRKIIKKGNRGR